MLGQSHQIYSVLAALALLSAPLSAQENLPDLLPGNNSPINESRQVPEPDRNNPLLPTEDQPERTLQQQREIQSGFPPELILSPPSQEKLSQANRFVQGTIDPQLPLNLVLGRPKILQLASAPSRIYVPSGEIIKTEIIDDLSGKEVAVTGLQPGTTTLILWFEDPRSGTGQTAVSYLVRVFKDPVLARPIEDLERELNLKFPNSLIELDQIEDRMIVRGQTPNVIEMSQILQVLTGARGVPAAISRPEESVTLTTALNFEDNLDPLEMEEQAAARRRLIDPLALAQAGIINQLQVVGEQQVMLKVTVAEVNRTAARSIGLNFAVDADNGTTVFRTLTGNLAPIAGGAAGQSSANALVSLDMGQIRLAVEALRRLNLSRTLAEPNLVAMNGESADFQAGGRFPVPVIAAGGIGNGQNLQGVNFIPFGVQLRFRPVIQDGNVIRLQLNAEVSTRDESLGTAIGGGAAGTQVTGLNSRNFSTTVQLRSGQTIAVAGLMQTNYGASTDRVPFWGDLPLIGWTGGVNRSSSGEQELVILVTPHLVAPITESERLPLPGDDTFEPTDLEFYVANRLESRRSRDFRSSVQTDYARLRAAERYQVQDLIMGTAGPTDRYRVLETTSPAPSTRIPQSDGIEPIPPLPNSTDAANRRIGG